MFTLTKNTTIGRHGLIKTAHGPIQTPFFFPVATAGAMRGITHDDLAQLGAQALLCNTYHLHLRPGEDVIRETGGLHQFIGWDQPILTDSGGFQVFSLRHRLMIEEKGVHFQSHIDGASCFIGPSEAMDIQHKLGADIIMCFDECPASTAKRSDIQKAVDRTLKWAKECKYVHDKKPKGKLLFGIVQGGLERDLREYCAKELIAMDFDGYAIGGLAVGESQDEMFDVLDTISPLLPKDKPRYLMGVGRIEQMRAAITKGVDMFDCVLPMREARHGTIYLSNQPNIRISNTKFTHDHSTIDPDSPSDLSRKHSKSFLHHLFNTNERLAETIACKQNMAITLKFMRDIRERISSAQSL